MSIANTSERSTPNDPAGAGANASVAGGAQNADHGMDVSNIVAIAGMTFCVLAAGLYFALFYFVSGLPADQQQLEQLRGNTAILIRLVALGASAGLLNVVALVLCGIGLLLSRRSQWLPIAGAIAAAILLLSVGAVIFLSMVGGT